MLLHRREKLGTNSKENIAYVSTHGSTHTNRMITEIEKKASTSSFAAYVSISF